VPRWGLEASDYLLVVERDGVAGIAVTRHSGLGTGVQVWTGLGSLLGVIHHRSLDSVFTFSESAGGSGRVNRCLQPSGAWCVVDASGSEIARVTPRPLPGSHPRQEGQPKDRLLARLAGALRRSYRSLPEGCEIVESGPAFDWVRHGLTIALAALCDPDVHGRALRPSGGGP
jgi:hypothetical protein